MFRLSRQRIDRISGDRAWSRVWARCRAWTCGRRFAACGCDLASRAGVASRARLSARTRVRSRGPGIHCGIDDVEDDAFGVVVYSGTPAARTRVRRPAHAAAGASTSDHAISVGLTACSTTTVPVRRVVHPAHRPTKRRRPGPRTACRIRAGPGCIDTGRHRGHRHCWWAHCWWARWLRDRDATAAHWHTDAESRPRRHGAGKQRDDEIRRSNKGHGESLSQQMGWFQQRAKQRFKPHRNW